MLKSSLGKHVTSNLNPDEMERLERKVWLPERRKGMVDTWEIENDFVKQYITKMLDDKFKDKR